MSSDRTIWYVEQNRLHWSSVTQIHLAPGGTDLEAFRRGRSSLHRVETEEFVPLVRDKSVVHLQCHIGVDSLSLLRAGASEVVGVDFDPAAILAARDLASSVSLSATFVHSDVYEAADHLDRVFDAVFVSHGALCWLPNVDRWARVVSRLLRPGGLLYLNEFHPLLWSLADESTVDRLILGHPHLERPEPTRFEAEPDYLNRSAITPPQYCWNHGLGEIVTALSSQGMRVRHLHEFPFCVASVIPVLRPLGDGYFGIPESASYPLSYSILAHKELAGAESFGPEVPPGRRETST